MATEGRLPQSFSQTANGAGSAAWSRVGGTSDANALQTNDGDTSYHWAQPDGGFSGGNGKTYIMSVGFIFSVIPAGSTIDNIQLNIIRRSSDVASGFYVRDETVQLTRAGVAVGNNVADLTSGSDFTSAYSTKTYSGAPVSFWGYAWTRDDIVVSGLGLQYAAYGDADSTTAPSSPQARITYFAIIVTYTEPAGARRQAVAVVFL